MVWCVGIGIVATNTYGAPLFARPNGGSARARSAIAQVEIEIFAQQLRQLLRPACGGVVRLFSPVVYAEHGAT